MEERGQASGIPLLDEQTVPASAANSCYLGMILAKLDTSAESATAEENAMQPSPADVTSDDVVRQFLDAGAAHSAELGADHDRLWSSLTDATRGGGRFRPALVTGVYRGLGGMDTGLAATVGAAVELLHTAFVIHDDVIDGDDTRRGRPNVSGTFYSQARQAGADPARARTYADSAGILAGDLALVGALRMVATCSAPPETVARLLDLFDRALHASAAGELADVRLSLDLAPVDLHEVVVMEEQKTAAYSFVLPLQAGAVLAGAEEPLVESLGELGRLLGIGYQLLDDLRGVFGDERLTGKSALGDLREGKRTPLVTHAQTTPAWQAIAPLVGNPSLTAAQADQVRETLTVCGSRGFVWQLARQHIDAALDLAAAAHLPVGLFAWVLATDDLLRRAA
jgi:geranylgeranyl diphosphate synthase type II